MASPREQLVRLKLAGQVAQHVEILDVRVLRLSGRVYPKHEPKGGSGVALRITRRAQSSQIGSQLLAEVRFTLAGVQEKEPRKKVAELATAMELSYRLTTDIKFTRQQLKAFSELNAVYNAWPYWRELVQSTIGRMGLPRLVIPVFRITRPKPADATPGEKPRRTGVVSR